MEQKIKKERWGKVSRELRRRLERLPEPAAAEDLARAMFLAGRKPQHRDGWEGRTPTGRSRSQLRSHGRPRRPLDGLSEPKGSGKRRSGS